MREILMNREIKFKAKRKDNNEWVYGYYSKIKHFLGLKYLHYIIDEKQNYVEIIPETVSQHIGLDDKNGEFDFEIADAYGNTKIVHAKVDWIDNRNIVLSNLSTLENNLRSSKYKNRIYSEEELNERIGV